MNTGAATLSGKPTRSGLYTFIITAYNGVLPDALQEFDLTVT